MTVLVTGGAGFVGSHFVRAACEVGRRVVVLDDLSGGASGAPSLPADALFVRGDIGDRTLVQLLCHRHGVKALVHFAGRIQVGESVQKPALYFDVNLVRSLALLDAMRAAEVPHVLFSSTAAVYGVPEGVPIPESARKEPVNPYGATKLAFEQALQAYGTAYGIRWAALRYFNAAGAHPDGTLREHHEPETHLLPRVIDAGLLRGPPLAVFGDDYPTRDGTCVRDYIHICDLADAHLAALAHLESGHASFAANLGTGRGYTVRELLDAAAQVLGHAIPNHLAVRRAGDPPELIADPERARELLHLHPRRSDLKTLIEDTLRSRLRA